MSDEELVLSIFLVDDHPKAMHPQKRIIEPYIKSKGFTLNWIEDSGKNKGKQVFEILEKQSIDIILLDNNLSKYISGLDILEQVRKKHDLTDILFYSAKTKDEEFIKANNFRFTEIVRGREISDRVIELIDKSLMKWDNIVFLRGIVISKVIELEHKINEIFENYFQIPSKFGDNFHSWIMESGQISLQSKKKILMKILQEENWAEKFQGFSNLSELQDVRNALAHGKLKTETNVLIVYFEGKPVEYNKKEIEKIFKKIRKMSALLDKLQDEIHSKRKKI